MSMTDPIADYLTRIRNAGRANHTKVDIPASKLLKELTRILQEEGYIRNYTVNEEGPQGTIRIYLKYQKDKTPAISGIERVSRSGLRKYSKANSLPRVLNGLGIAILSTPKGLLADRNARSENVGGEVLCYIW